MELATAPDGIHIRESDQPEAVIRTTPAALGVLIRAIKTGRLDRNPLSAGRMSGAGLASRASRD